jgi:hypothetical protein
MNPVKLWQIGEFKGVVDTAIGIHNLKFNSEA